MNKSVLLIGNHPPPHGGVPTHIEYLAQYLQGRGWVVHVLSLKFHPIQVRRLDGYTVYSPARRKSRLAVLARWPYVVTAWKHRSFAVDAPSDFVRCIDILALAERIARHEGVDAIGAYHVLPAGLAGAWLSKALRIPLVTSIFGEFYSAREYHARRIREVELVFSTSRKIFSTSEHCAKGPLSIGLSPRVEVLYYGIDVSRFSPNLDGTALRYRLGISEHDPLVLFTGRMVREMGLHTFLDAIPLVLKKRYNMKFLVVGRSGDLLARARELQHRLPASVFVLPDVPSEDLPLCYAASTMLAAPSASDRACLSLAIAEAMATAKPTIGTRVGGVPEIVRHGDTGLLIPPESPQALAEAIDTLAGDEDTMKRMGRRAREVALGVFNQERTNASMERVFLEIIR